MLNSNFADGQSAEGSINDEDLVDVELHPSELTDDELRQLHASAIVELNACGDRIAAFQAGIAPGAGISDKLSTEAGDLAIEYRDVKGRAKALFSEIALRQLGRQFENGIEALRNALIQNSEYERSLRIISAGSYDALDGTPRDVYRAIGVVTEREKNLATEVVGDIRANINPNMKFVVKRPKLKSEDQGSPQ